MQGSIYPAASHTIPVTHSRVVGCEISHIYIYRIV